MKWTPQQSRWATQWMLQQQLAWYETSLIVVFLHPGNKLVRKQKDSTLIMALIYRGFFFSTEWLKHRTQTWLLALHHLQTKSPLQTRTTRNAISPAGKFHRCKVQLFSSRPCSARIKFLGIPSDTAQTQKSTRIWCIKATVLTQNGRCVYYRGSSISLTNYWVLCADRQIKNCYYEGGKFSQQFSTDKRFSIRAGIFFFFFFFFLQKCGFRWVHTGGKPYLVQKKIGPNLQNSYRPNFKFGVALQRN